MSIFKRKEPLFKYDSENLVYRKTNKILKYRVIVAVLFISFGATLVSAVQFKSEIGEKEKIIREKENRIKQISSPLREEYYVEDLYKAIGFKLTKEQYERFSFLALKYRNQIEEAKVPATLVFWVFYKESRFNVKAENNNSTAKGLGQMLDGTWNEMCKMKGYSVDGRFNEQKQVTVTLDYLNYLYNIHKDWKKVMKAYGGNKLHYPFHFLVK